MALLRAFLALSALLFAAVTISAPGVARGLHELNHAGAPVAGDEHHHHGEDGGVTSHHSGVDAVPQSDDTGSGKFGHSHMANIALDALPFGSGNLTEALAERSDVPAAANTPALGSLGWMPPVRPPRTA
jgi:hypothetical protein